MTTKAKQMEIEDAPVVENGNGALVKPNGNGDAVLGMFDKAIAMLSGEGAESAVKALDKLMELYERGQDRNAVLMFNEGMVKFQAECGPIYMNKTGSITTKNGGSFKYQYADTNQIRKVVTPLLNKHGFTYYFDQQYLDGRVLVTFVLNHVGGHSQRSSFSCPEIDDTRDNRATSLQQKSGIADTYAARRAMQNALGITLTDESDTDGAAHGGPVQTISPAQVTEIDTLIAETGTDVEKFLRHYKIADVSELTTQEYAKARSVLLKRKAGA